MHHNCNMKKVITKYYRLRTANSNTYDMRLLISLTSHDLDYWVI